MVLRIRYFGALREELGIGQEEVDPPADVGRAGELMAWLRSRGRPWEEGLATRRSVLCAVNQAYADADTPVRTGDEVAFFPPVTGG